MLQALPPLRRIVAGHDGDGKSVVLSDNDIQSKVIIDNGINSIIHKLILNKGIKDAPCQGLSDGALWTTESVPSKDTNSE